GHAGHLGRTRRLSHPRQRPPRLLLLAARRRGDSLLALRRRKLAPAHSACLGEDRRTLCLGLSICHHTAQGTPTEGVPFAFLVKIPAHPFDRIVIPQKPVAIVCIAAKRVLGF